MNTTHSSEIARKKRRRLTTILLLSLIVFAPRASLAFASESPLSESTREQLWLWPGRSPSLVRTYEQPPTPYDAGHRGIDTAVSGTEIIAPDAGTVAFRGVVVDRPLITIDHGGGLVSTLEPVSSDLSAGDHVARGETVGTLATGGHTPDGALHLGARLHGEYINPLALLGAVEHPVLLPCCA